MGVLELDSLITQIQELKLPLMQEVKLIVQAADLTCFKESYKGKLEILDPFGKLSLVLSEAGTTGIFFYGEQDNHAPECSPYDIQQFKNSTDVMALWFVYVVWDVNASSKELQDLIDQYELYQNFNRIMLLIYPMRIIKQIYQSKQLVP